MNTNNSIMDSMKNIVFIIICMCFGVVFSQEKDLEKQINEAKQFTAIGNTLLTDSGIFL